MRAFLLSVAAGCLVVGGIVGACGSPQRNTSLPSPSVDGGDAGADGAAPLPAFDALISFAKDDVTQMTEVARFDSAVSEARSVVATITAQSRDTCVRAVVVASEGIEVFFDDASDLPRASKSRSPTLVPTRGPICIRRGSLLNLVATSSGRGQARGVVWTTP